MSLFEAMDIAGTGMNAQSLRLNLTSSNLANADAVSSSVGTTYRARHAIFATALDDARFRGGAAGVRVASVVESQAPPRKEYAPDHPAADANGYIYRPNVSVMDELADMISASRSFQTDVEVVNTTKQMLLRTLSLGQ